MSHLHLEFADTNSVAGDPPIHDVLPHGQVDVPLLQMPV